MFQVLRPGVIPKVTAPLQAPRRLRPSPGTAQPCQADVSGGSAELLARPGHQSTARGTRPGPWAALGLLCPPGTCRTAVSPRDTAACDCPDTPETNPNATEDKT